jgi:hypothetical protein
MRAAAPTVLLFVAFAAGCAKPKPPLPPPVAISGKVVYAAGTPVAGMVIKLSALDERFAGDGPSGALDKDGRYTLNAIPGRYRVTLLPIPAQAGSAGKSDQPVPKKGDPKDAFSAMARYRDLANSPLELTVPAAGGEMDKLTVESR